MVMSEGYEGSLTALWTDLRRTIGVRSGQCGHRHRPTMASVCILAFAFAIFSCGTGAYAEAEYSDSDAFGPPEFQSIVEHCDDSRLLFNERTCEAFCYAVRNTDDVAKAVDASENSSERELLREACRATTITFNDVAQTSTVFSISSEEEEKFISATLSRHVGMLGGKEDEHLSDRALLGIGFLGNEDGSSINFLTSQRGISPKMLEDECAYISFLSTPPVYTVTYCPKTTELRERRGLFLCMSRFFIPSCESPSRSPVTDPGKVQITLRARVSSVKPSRSSRTFAVKTSTPKISETKISEIKTSVAPAALMTTASVKPTPVRTKTSPVTYASLSTPDWTETSDSSLALASDSSDSATTDAAAPWEANSTDFPVFHSSTINLTVEEYSKETTSAAIASPSVKFFPIPVEREYDTDPVEVTTADRGQPIMHEVHVVEDKDTTTLTRRTPKSPSSSPFVTPSYLLLSVLGIVPLLLL